MMATEPASTGAVVMSRFHQLSGGNSGSGPGSGPPSVLAAITTIPAHAAIDTTAAASRDLEWGT